MSVEEQLAYNVNWYTIIDIFMIVFFLSRGQLLKE